MKKLTQAALLALACAALPTAVQAAPFCAASIVEDGIIAYGEVRGTGHLGLCVERPSGAIIFYDVPTCDLLTPIGYVFDVSGTAAYAGTSIIGPVVGAVNCGGNWIDPFLPAFLFGLQYTGLNGIDIAYGTHNRDYLHGNYHSFPGPADNAPDKLCGYEDDDVLVGDLEPMPLPLACLNGGTNYPPGDDCVNGSKFACENLIGYGLVTLNSCGCGDAPPEIWQPNLDPNPNP